MAQAILLREPRNFDALHIVALASYHARDLQTALKSVERALSVRSDMADAYNTHGLILRALSRLPDAAAQFSQAVKLNARSREAHYNLANCQQDLGRLSAALDHYDAALRIDPGMLVAWNNRGLALRKLGRLPEAAASFGEAIKRGRDFAPAHYNLADALAAMPMFDDAIRAYDRAIALQPDFAEAHCNRANALMELGRLEDALTGYDKAINLRPSFHQAHMSRGIALAALERLAEAQDSVRRSISLKPDYAEAHYNLGKILREQKRFEEAVACYDSAIRLRPDHAEAYGNRGNVLKDLGRLDEALACYDRAVSLKPDDAEAHYNRGNVLGEMMRDDEALASFDVALKLKPDYADPALNKSQLLLGRGRFAEGFALYEARWRKLGGGRFLEGFDLYRARWKADESDGSAPRTDIPKWDGKVLDGQLLLLAEQGIGDEIFYVSLLSLLDLGHLRVTVEADRRLHPIYSRSFVDIPLLEREQTTREISEDFAAQAAIGDLGAILGLDEVKIAMRRSPFLVADGERREALRRANPFLAARPVCGLSWKSANKNIGAEKSLRLIDLAPLLTTPGITFVNLQYGEVAEEIEEVRRVLGVEIHQAAGLDVFNDIDGLLALVDCCDAVLTSSNVTAHLAGSLAKPGVVLVPTGKGSLWYWQGGPNDLWYPSLRRVPQDRAGHWQAAIQTAVALVKDIL